MPLDKRCCWVCRFVAGLAAVAIPRRQDVVPDSVSLLERGRPAARAARPRRALRVHRQRPPGRAGRSHPGARRGVLAHWPPNGVMLPYG